MFEKFLFGACLVLMVWSVRCDDNCDQLGVLLYEEIGCKPVKDQPADPCPSRYDCSHLEEKGEHCFFQGKKYKNREGLPEDAVYKTCNGGCFCMAAYSPSLPSLSLSRFTCAAFDCPEFLGGSPLNSTDCIRTYNLTGCCSSGQICPPFDNIATCKVDGHTYKEGQQFSLKDSCSKCVCQKGFAGKFEAPFCERSTCAVELRHSEDIRQRCAPIYRDNLRCCPFSWVCRSSKNDTKKASVPQSCYAPYIFFGTSMCCLYNIIRHTTHMNYASETDIFSPAIKNDKSAKTCKFGEREIKSGQVLKTTVEQFGKKYNVKCDCQLPPLLSCVVEF